MRATSYLYSAITILAEYNGKLPFSVWIKDYFRHNKKYGSKDRKHITHLCYCYFRVGLGFKNTTKEKEIINSVFLCGDDQNALLQNLDEELNQKAGLNINDKTTYATENLNFNLHQVFPFEDELSENIDAELFAQSFLIQPSLFLRIRPGFKEEVISVLDSNELTYKLSDDCVELPNATKADEIFELDKEVVIQDFNSQKTLELVNNKLPTTNYKLSSWDCCAASGGKSILLHDLYPDTDLFVSDVRESIISNLKKRFERAGIKKYKSSIIDASKNLPANKFDLIICDAPCSGSGTWSRTPEQLHFFKADKIDYYANLQKKILTNVSKCLKPKSHLLYITCSVFKKENEEVVEHVVATTDLELTSMKFLKGYTDKADTLFTALFCKP